MSNDGITEFSKMKKYDEKFTKCPACGSENIIHYHKDFRENTIYLCKACRVQFMNPVYSDEYLDDYYSKYVILDVDEEKKVILTTKQAYVINDNLKAIDQVISTKGDMLDFGIGNGTHAVVARERGWNVSGYDVDCKITNTLAEKYNMDVRCGDFFKTNWSEKSFDLIYINQVLEHIKNPVDYLKHFRSVLKQNGYLFITVPNINSTSNRIKLLFERIGLRKSRVGKYYDSDHHVFYYSPESLANLVKNYGFEVIYTRNCVKPKVERSKVWLYLSNKLIERFYSTSTFMLIARKN